LPPPPPKINIIKNPSFELGTTSWIFYTNAQGTFSVTTPGYSGNKSAKIYIATEGTNMQLYQIGVKLESYTKYRLSFAAYSTAGHDMNVRLFKHGSPYTAYAPDFRVNLGATWQTYTTEFTTKGFSGNVSDGRLMFSLIGYGRARDTYRVDNVTLVKI
jgi:hypothetical protein